MNAIDEIKKLKELKLQCLNMEWDAAAAALDMAILELKKASSKKNKEECFAYMPNGGCSISDQGICWMDSIGMCTLHKTIEEIEASEDKARRRCEDFGYKFKGVLNYILSNRETQNE